MTVQEITSGAGSDPVDLRIRGGTVVTADPEETVVRADVYVDDGRVLAIGGVERPARTVIDASHMLVMPGMCNLHDHLRDLTPGIRVGEGLKLDALLRKMWQLSESQGPDEYRIGAALGTARLLKAGVTSVVDHIYPFHKPGLAEAAISGYTETGIRWYMARGVMTRGYDAICETQPEAFSSIRELCDGIVPRDRLFIAPVSLRQATAEVYAAARRLADELGVKLYTHISETDDEVDSTIKTHGVRPVELLRRLGFFGADTTLVHCVKLSPEEIRALSSSGTHVVHCPTNHMKLAKGVTPVPQLLQAGVNVGLGADMMTDILDEMRQEVQLQSLHESDPSILQASTALKMATRNGTAALGCSDQRGSIAPGQRADLVCLDIERLGLQPVLDPTWTLVHRCSQGDVTHVMIDGKLVVRDRRLTMVDEDSLLSEARDVTAHYLRRAGVTDQHVLL